ncbi:uncharacterized protein BO87DRAFT_57993 [Aspergillus neoniger CBS 115656]|uniref:Uncharacterized protein n=1 Tax=Aspergillus neoniger (strain CBS 115656) TaxID=1448310 RepID=A0A318YQL3_ASPNB|nr:hypothetical protein BO87DRAFT_57993 [Aspergillus neoniger CBS 115656]PYH34370.1 hypothetical protein BO87DRAFT_57993 [Aspergillus neoniger CBS 115656]
MQLSWKPGYSLSNRPVKRSAARRTNRGRLGNADGPQQFVFVAEHPMRDHPEPDVNVSKEASLSVETPFKVSGDASPTTRAADSPGPETDSRTAELQPHRDNCEEDQGQSPCSSTPTDDGQLQLADGDAFYEWSSQVATTIESSPMAASDFPNTTTFMPPSVLYNSIWQRFGPVLQRYSLILLPVALVNAH